MNIHQFKLSVLSWCDTAIDVCGYFAVLVTMFGGIALWFYMALNGWL